MPSERLSMRRIRELLRLKFENGPPGRVIAASLGLSKGRCTTTCSDWRLRG